MKIWDLTIIGFALSIIGIIVLTFLIESQFHDVSIWLMLIIYFIPALIFSSFNGFVLDLTNKKTSKFIYKIGIGLIPVFILIFFALSADSPLSFIGQFALIPILITNLIWITKISTSK